MPGNFKMTTKEVCDDMRSRGCKIGEPALRQGIETGLYPFGSLINTGETGRRVFHILRVDYMRWADENLPPYKEE